MSGSESSVYDLLKLIEIILLIGRDIRRALESLEAGVIGDAVAALIDDEVGKVGVEELIDLLVGLSAARRRLS